MPIKRRVWIKWSAFVIATFLAAFTIFYIPLIQRKIPEVPGDNIHIGITRINECINCHSESGGSPLPQNHFAREQCLYCHRIREFYPHKSLSEM